MTSERPISSALPCMLSSRVDASRAWAFSLSAGYHKQDKVMPIARNEVASSLGNPDYWPSRLKFLPRQAIVEKTFEIKGGHIRVLRVIPPCLATEPRPVVRRSVVVFAPTLGSSTRTRDDMNRTHCRLSSRCS